MDILVKVNRPTSVSPTTYTVKYDNRSGKYVTNPGLRELGYDVARIIGVCASIFSLKYNLSRVYDEVYSDMVEYALDSIPKYNPKRATLDTFLWACCRNRAGSYWSSNKRREKLGIVHYDYNDYTEENYYD